MVYNKRGPCMICRRLEPMRHGTCWMCKERKLTDDRGEKYAEGVWTRKVRNASK